MIIDKPIWVTLKLDEETSSSFYFMSPDVIEALQTALYLKFDPTREKYNFIINPYCHDTCRLTVTVCCKIHGTIVTKPLEFLFSDRITNSTCCPMCNEHIVCGSLMKFENKNAFINCLKLKFPELTDYINKLSISDETHKNFAYTKEQEFICSEHGAFKAIPKIMYREGRLCPICAHQRNWDTRERKTDESVISDARKVHRGKYDYSELHYTGPKDKMKIICHRKNRLGVEHGPFYQTYNKHVSQREGCPICAKNASYLEDEMCWKLNDAGIAYIRSHRFPFKKLWPVDIWIPELNVVIECQGRQHFTMENNSFHKTVKEHQALIERDEEKFNLLQQHGITVLYFATCEIPEEFLAKHTYYKTSDDVIKVLQNMK